MKRLLIGLALILHSYLLAQDPMFSQVFFNRPVYNPAYTGNQLGVNGLISHRSQWLAIPSNISTSNLQMCTALPRLNGGVGGMLTHNVEGAGKLRSLSMDVMGSKLIRIKDQTDSKVFAYFGLGASFNQKSVDWDQFVFGDQLDPVNGITSPTSAQSPSVQQRYYPDFNSGLAIKGVEKKVFFSAGFSVDHLLRPTESIFGTTEGRLPHKYVVDLFVGAPMLKSNAGRSPLLVVPGGVVMKQAEFMTAVWGANFIKSSIVFGAWYKSRFFNFKATKNDAFILNAGISGKFNKEYNYNLVYSYDLTVNRLVTNTAGSHEITIIIRHYNKAKYNSAKYSKCATLDAPSEIKMPFIW